MRLAAVRRLLPLDALDYRAIRLAALQAAPEAFGSTYAAEAERPIEFHAGRLARSTVFGAYEGPRITGLIGFMRQDGPKQCHKGSVWGFYVEPGGRGGGTGSALLSAVLEAARGVVEQVTLTVVQENAAAIGLYERFGFRRYGVEPRALRTADGYSDEVLMVLFLGAPGG